MHEEQAEERCVRGGRSNGVCWCLLEAALWALWTPRNTRHSGKILLDIPSSSIPVCNLTPLLPPSPAKQTQSQQLNKPIMEVTRSLLGGVGCKAGVCSKAPVKKIEISTV